MCGQKRDRGYTLIEILLVVVVLGILATVVVLSVGGVRGRAEETACSSDRRQLATAVEAYFVEFSTDAVPDAGGPDGYEQTLLTDGLLGSVSTLHDVTADGAVVAESGSGC